MFQYAAVYVKKHLTANLVLKIKLLQLLSQQRFVDKGTLLKEYERLAKAPASPGVLKYLGIPSQSPSTVGKSLNSNDALLSKVNNSIKDSKATTSGNYNQDKMDAEASNHAPLVLSSRVKPLEELPTPKKTEKETLTEEEYVPEKYIHNDLLSPYSNQTLANGRPRHSPAKSNGSIGPTHMKESPIKRQLSKEEKSGSPTNNNQMSKNKSCSLSKNGDILEYLIQNHSTSSCEIDFPNLIRDEIAKVDKALVKGAKTAMQIGGTTLLLAILDCYSSTLWVANVGDSRGVLCNSSSVPIGEVMPLSYDHKPSQVNSEIVGK